MLTVTKRMHGDTALIDLSGAIDGGDSCREIHEAIKGNLDEGHRKFVLNLSEVEWINSLGVGFLVAASVSAARESATVRLFGLSPRVDTLLRSSGVVPHVWKDFADEQEALESLR
jgi:anti-anti-sigma factor